jgi:hypothetical protein
VDRHDEGLRGKSTPELLRSALEEVKLLAKAEVLHAKQELRDEVVRAKKAGILAGVALGVGISGLSVLLVALALALPWPDALGALIVGIVLVVIAAVCGLLASRSMPTRPLQRTQDRLKADLSLAREQLV